MQLVLGDTSTNKKPFLYVAKRFLDFGKEPVIEMGVTVTDGASLVMHFPEWPVSANPLLSHLFSSEAEDAGLGGVDPDDGVDVWHRTNAGTPRYRKSGSGANLVMNANIGF